MSQPPFFRQPVLFSMERIYLSSPLSHPILQEVLKEMDGVQDTQIVLAQFSGKLGQDTQLLLASVSYQ